jgi:hypothetical protein
VEAGGRKGGGGGLRAVQRADKDVPREKGLEVHEGEGVGGRVEDLRI